MTLIKSKLMPAAAAMLILLLFTFAPLRASAEAHGSFYIPDGAVPAGQDFTVSVEFTASESIGTVQAAISYNESYMQFVSGDGASGGGGIINIRAFPDSDTSTMNLDLTFKALREGSAQINLTNGSVMSPDGVGLSTSITAYATITIGPAAPSDSTASDSYSDTSSYADSSAPDTYEPSDGELTAVLKSLTVETGVLKPDFSPGIYDYTVTVPHEVDVFELEGVTASETDSIWYEGAKYLVDGKNQRTITVTSADGTVSNVYTITIYREPGEDESEDAVESTEDKADSEQEINRISETTTTTRKPAVNSDDGKSGMDDLRDELMPALYVAMAVIVLAVVILIVWIRTKTKNKLK